MPPRRVQLDPPPRPEPPAANTWHDWLLVPPPQEGSGWGKPRIKIDVWIKKYDPESDEFVYSRVTDIFYRDKYPGEWVGLPTDARPIAWMRVEGPLNNMETPS